MHQTAMNNCKRFFDCYSPSFGMASGARVVEIGSQDINGTLRSVCPAAFEYVGVDFVAGRGVDIVLDDPYKLPFADASADIVLSSSCFEHSEMFWLTYLEIMRVLKPRGLFYLNVPSNGGFHRHPVDCWRFYPDSGRALVTWARRNGMDSELLESYTSDQSGDGWNDFVAVFLKDRRYLAEFPGRIVGQFNDFSNGLVHGSDDFFNSSALSQDQVKLTLIDHVLKNDVKMR